MVLNMKTIKYFLEKISYCYLVNYFNYTFQNIINLILLINIIDRYKKNKLTKTDYAKYKKNRLIGMKLYNNIDKIRYTSLLVIFNILSLLSLINFFKIDKVYYSKIIHDMGETIETIILFGILAILYYLNDRCLFSKKNSKKFENLFFNKKVTIFDGIFFILCCLIFLFVFHYGLEINPLKSIRVIYNLIMN